ncbi:Two-component response regulator arr2 [Thalictrum thalictroides]|uniref:Two-component response regulator arr2 n=1 Tax=Thalictrum thalictroides TaxID=46969 RepID=A0A7J6VCG9_THATH|nr:Two-component response regulator arr2 [Thalictrum thalictroides]
MSSDHGLDIMERGLEAGARFFFPKPLTLKDYENIWQFVYTENVEYFQGINIDEGHQGPPPPPPSQDRRLNSLSISDDIRRHGRSSSSSSNTSHGKRQRSQDGDHGNKKQKRPYKKLERKEDQDFGKKTTSVPLKKTRVVWTTQLHEKFLQALSILKMARAVPKRIQALMKVRRLNRANIASHLQKYRLYQNKYKGTSESDYPRRRIRMRLPDETEYHDYSPRNDLSYDYQNRAQSRLRTQDNFRPPHNFNHVPSARPQYHQEGSNDNFMAQENYGHPTAVTNPENLGRSWMSGAPTMNQPNVGACQSLFGSSAPLCDNDLNIGSTTNAIPVMAELQGMAEFLPNASLDPNFGNLGFESLQNSPPSVDIASFDAFNEILTGTIGGEIPNNDNALDISRMDEIRKGNKPVEEEAEDGFSLPHNPLYLNGMNSNFTSQGESFVVNPNYITTVGEYSTKALVNPNMLQQGNEVDNSGWFNSVNDIADFLFNQTSEKENEEEGDGGYVNPEFDSSWFVQDGENNLGAT